MIDRLPPRIVRRLVFAPLVLALSLLLLAASPALLVLAVIADLILPGNWRTTRIAAFGTAYLALEVVGLVGMFILWISSGLGLRIGSTWFIGVHFAFMRWWLRTIDRVARRCFHIKVVIEDRPEPRAGPILVFGRHAGPGNSLLLIGTILVGYGRRPRCVMLAKLQWEPLYDTMLNRLPNRFIRHDPTQRDIYLKAIGELADGLGDDDAFVLFPEGKDFTPRVRKRAIAYLRDRGYEGAAQRAESMRYVLPPRHGGVMAALKRARGADVVFVAHALLEDVGTFKDLWRQIPLRRPIVARYWRIPPSEVPKEEEELIEWLYGWWERIDGWIADHTARAS